MVAYPKQKTKEYDKFHIMTETMNFLFKSMARFTLPSFISCPSKLSTGHIKGIQCEFSGFSFSFSTLKRCVDSTVMELWNGSQVTQDLYIRWSFDQHMQ